MLAEFVAMLSAMGWAGDAVLIRLGTRRSTIFAGMLVSFFVSVICIWSYLVCFSTLDFLRSPAMLYFLISGCLQPLCARALYYEGLTRIGVSRAGPLRGSEPFFAAAIAVTFLHERPTIPVYLGTILIVASVWIISWGQRGQVNWRPIDVAFPLGAALISAVSQSLRKQGLKILPNPFVAAVTVTSTSLILLLVFLFVTKRIHLLRMERQSFFFFLVSAFVATTAQILNFVALGKGDLSVIIPLLNTTPLFSVIFSALFLRRMETVTPRTIVGALLMIAGIVTITAR